MFGLCRYGTVVNVGLACSKTNWVLRKRMGEKNGRNEQNSPRTVFMTAGDLSNCLWCRTYKKNQ